MRNRLIAIIRRLLGGDRALARCRVPSRIALRLLLLVLAVSACRLASAGVSITGNVIPANNPFTSIDEGLPADGNFINIDELPNKQTYFEGRHLDNVLADPNDDTNVNIPEIIVGQTSFGTLLISGESALRNQDLIIGDSGEVNGILRRGTGVVRITGFGSLYNNDPFIIPSGLPANFSSQTPRPTDVGFDLYVGRTGTGTLEITAGARAEIQDAVIVGDDPAALGILIVDGLDTFLGSGGFDTNEINEEVHEMIIGRRGVGYMTISGGATVNTVTVAPILGDAPVAAVIGADVFEDIANPDPGGNGTVTVTGAFSKWILNGSLQVGGFDRGIDGLGGEDELEGDDVRYNSEFGRGTLYVQDGAVVSVLDALDVVDPETTDLLLAIGRFGRVELAGGTINVGAGLEDESRPDTNQILNDGVIKGWGRINTGIFRNRYLGQVRVDAGSHLIIDSSSEFTDTGDDLEPLMNFGLIEVIGTEESRAELEFVRAPEAASNPRRPFINRPIPAPAPGAFDGGLISAQNATLRFDSGILNEGTMAFTKGMNIITGRVDNVSGATPGRFLVGPDTTVVIEDDFSSGGFVIPAPPAPPIISVAGGGTIIVLDPSSFTMAGELRMELSVDNPSRILVDGDVGIDGSLSITFAPDALSSLVSGSAFELISFGGQVGGVDLSDPLMPVPDLGIPFTPALLEINGVAAIKALTGLDPLVSLVGDSIFLSFIQVGGPGGVNALGPDFNGDGIVNNADLGIWLANVGISSGASVLQGDADSDGDVDGDDFLFWQRNVGQPMPWTSLPLGSGSEVAVPEPTSIALLLSGGLLALALRRRRSGR